MPKLVLSIARCLALAIVGVALAGSAGTAYSYRADTGTGSRGPEAEGARRRQGRVHRDRHRERLDAHDQLEADLPRPERQGGRGAYPQGQGRGRRRSDRPALRPVQEGSDGRVRVSNDTADVLERGGAYVNVHTCEERRRRDSGADQAAEPRHDHDHRPGSDRRRRPTRGTADRRPGTRPRNSSRPICGHTKGVSRRETPFVSKVERGFHRRRHRLERHGARLAPNASRVSPRRSLSQSRGLPGGGR